MRLSLECRPPSPSRYCRVGEGPLHRTEPVSVLCRLRGVARPCGTEGAGEQRERFGTVGLAGWRNGQLRSTQPVRALDEKPGGHGGARVEGRRRHRGRHGHGEGCLHGGLRGSVAAQLQVGVDHIVAGVLGFRELPPRQRGGGMRGRLGKLFVLTDTDVAPTGYRVFAAPGVDVKAETVRAAAAYARTHQLALLDLIPRNLGAMRALAFAQLVDPAIYRDDRIGPGRTAGHAILVAEDVIERSRAKPPADDVELAKLAANLKHYGGADAVVARTNARARRTWRSATSCSTSCSAPRRRSRSACSSRCGR